MLMAESTPEKGVISISCKTGRVDTFTWLNTIGSNGIPGNASTGTDILDLGQDIITSLYIMGTSEHITATTLRWDTQTLIIPSPGPQGGGSSSIKSGMAMV